MKKLVALLLSLIMVASLFTGCGSKPEEPKDNAGIENVEGDKDKEEVVPETEYPVTITDHAGNTVTIEKEPERVVSGYYISSSACIALGLKDRLVATEEKIETRPIYKLAASELIGKIGNVGSAKAFDLEACIAAEPDFVILPKKLKDQAKTLNDMQIPTIIVNPESNEQLAEMITMIGTATNVNKEAKALTDEYTKIQAKVADLLKDVKDEEKPVVYMCGTSSYLTTAPKNMFQASLVTIAGGVNAGDVLDGDSWVDIPYEQLLEMNPDVMIIPTNNFANAQPGYTAEQVMADTNLAEVTAVKEGAVYNMPIGYEAWDSPVPSGALGTLWLTAVLYPDVYSMEEFADDAAVFYKTFYGFELDKTTITG